MTLQGFLFGLAAFCAVVALSPEAPNRSENQIKIALTIAVGVLVAFAASMRQGGVVSVHDTERRDTIWGVHPLK